MILIVLRINLILPVSICYFLFYFKVYFLILSIYLYPVVPFTSICRSSESCRRLNLFCFIYLYEQCCHKNSSGTNLAVYLFDYFHSTIVFMFKWTQLTENQSKNSFWTIFSRWKNEVNKVIKSLDLWRPKTKW